MGFCRGALEAARGLLGATEVIESDEELLESDGETIYEINAIYIYIYIYRRYLVYLLSRSQLIDLSRLYFGAARHNIYRVYLVARQYIVVTRAQIY